MCFLFRNFYFTMNYSMNEIYTALFLVFVIVFLLWWKGKKKFKLPPGPVGIFRFGKEPHKELDKLKKKYGSVFSLYIGWTYTVVIGDFEVLKEAYAKTTEKAAGFDILPDALGFSGQNGEEWVEQRKFCIKSMKDLEIGKARWESMIQIEVDDLVKLVSSFKGQPVEVNKVLVSSVSNNISYFMLGKQLPFDHPDRIFLDNIMEEIIHLLGRIPSGHWFPTLQDIMLTLKTGSVYKRLKKFNDFFRRETEKLKESSKNEKQDNFTIHYLKEMESHMDKPGHFFTEKNLYGNIQGLFIGGSETISSSIYWLFLIMATFHDIQKKVHDELDSVLGENEQIKWSDRYKIPFTFATIMEGQRWRTLTPLNSPRKPIKDIKLQNYDVPKGTTIITNIWSLHNDTKYWEAPEKFYPDRFLSENGKQVLTRPDSYIPFSYGRRNCPGETIALMEILLYFTAFMQKFTILPPKDIELNLSGIQGITYQPHSQNLHFILRKKKRQVYREL